MAEDTPNTGGTPLLGTRTFYSNTLAESFMPQFRLMMKEQTGALLGTQEALIRQINEPIVALTRKLDHLLDILDASGPRRSQSSAPTEGNGNGNRHREPPPPLPSQDAWFNPSPLHTQRTGQPPEHVSTTTLVEFEAA